MRHVSTVTTLAERKQQQHCCVMNCLHHTAFTAESSAIMLKTMLQLEAMAAGLSSLRKSQPFKADNL